MRVEIEGRDLPGARWCTDPGRHDEQDIYVGIGSKGQGEQLVAGSADSAHWSVEVTVVARDDGTVDFRGRLVDGPRGDRFIYLNWGTLGADGAFSMFRRAKLGLSELDHALIERADRPGASLRCVVNLTDDKGGPRCARVRPPDIAWHAQRSRARR